MLTLFICSIFGFLASFIVIGCLEVDKALEKEKIYIATLPNSKAFLVGVTTIEN